MPKPEVIQVRQGDFDTKYLRVNEDGARNRKLNPRKLRSIANNWEDASRDTITLVSDENGRYLIADGQHRIAAASQFFKKPVTLTAMIWQRNEVKNLSDFITAFNRGTPFSTANMLEVYWEASKWPAAAKDAQLSFVLRRYRSLHFSWVALMRGVAIADLWRDTGKLVTKAFNKEQLTQEVWLGYSEEGIREVVAAIKWWRPLAEAAYRSLGQNSALYSDAALATGISLYRKYHGDKNRLAEMAQRFLASNQMIVLKTLDYRQTRWFVNNIMKGMNYRVIKDYAELYGETGRE
jgi:hypothetical protein